MSSSNLKKWLARLTASFAKPGTPIPKYHTTPAPQPMLAPPKVQSPAPKASASKRPWQWIGPIGNIAVHGMNIGGMHYVGESMPLVSHRAWETPPKDQLFLINPSLPVQFTKVRKRPEQEIDYHPSYAKMSLPTRGGYLQWLADGRRDPEARPAYPLLFLMGLEHRIMAERPDHAELRLLLGELRELRACYRHEYHLDHQLSRLIHEAEWMLLKGDGPGLAAYRVDLLDPYPTMPITLKVCVARMVNAGVPIPFEWAIGTVLHLHLGSRRIGMTRMPDAFLDLAKIRFGQRMPGGVRIPKRKVELTHHYSPTSQWFTGAQREGIKLTPEWLPNPEALNWDPVIKLIDDVADELTPYATAQGPECRNNGSFSVLAALPPELRDKPYAAGLTALKDWLNSEPSQVRVTSLAELLEKTGQPIDTTVNARAHDHLANLLATLGWGMEPDPLFWPLRALKQLQTGKVVLFPKVDGQGLRAPPSPGWAAAQLVAAVMTTFVPHAIPALNTSGIAMGFNLTAAENRRLRAMSLAMGGTKLSDGDLRKMAQAVPEQEIPNAINVLCYQAGQLNVVRYDGVRILEKVFHALDVPCSELYSYLHKAEASNPKPPPAFDPLVVETASESVRWQIPRPPPGLDLRPAGKKTASKPGKAEPPRKSNGPPPGMKPKSEVVPPGAPAEPPPMPVLDMEEVERIRRETRQVSNLLAPIYAEEATPPAVPVSPPATAEPSAEPTSGFEGLDAEHAVFLAALLERETWPSEEFEALAKSFGLMPGGAAEFLNEWSFDRFDDAIIEDGDPMTINIALLR